MPSPELTKPMDRIFAGFSPFCSDESVFSTSQRQRNNVLEKILDQYHKYLLLKPVIYRKYSGVWVVTRPQRTDAIIEEFVNGAFDRVLRRDASRALTGIKLRRFHGLPGSNNYHLLDLEIDSETRLGDGSAIFVERQWKFTQRHGVYPHSAHLLLKQRK